MPGLPFGLHFFAANIIEQLLFYTNNNDLMTMANTFYDFKMNF